MDLFGVPFGLSILEKAVEVILERHKDLTQIAVIFPTQRSKIYFQQFLAKMTNKEAMLLPQLYEASEFLSEATLSPYQGILINQWQRNFILKEAIFKTEQDISKLFGNQLSLWAQDFLHFVSIGRRLLRFYDEILRERISFKALKKEALYTDYETHVEILLNIFKSYSSLLKERNLIDPVLKETALILDETFLYQFKAIYFVGAITMTQTETAFFEALNNYMPLGVFFQADKTHGLIAHQRVILDRWHKSERDIYWLNGERGFNNQLFEIKAFPNVSLQMGLVLKAITSALNEGIAPHHIAIVLPDEEFKYMFLTHLSEHNLNLTMGVDVKHTLTYSLLKNLFDLFGSETEDGFYYKPFLSLLSHPLIKGLYRQETIQLTEFILQHNIFYIKKRLLPKNPLFSFLNKVKERLKGESLISLSKSLSQILKEFSQHPNLTPFFTHYQEVMGFNKILEALYELSTLERLGGVLAEKTDFLTFFRFILKHLETLTYPLAARLTDAIQVMGILETRNLQFDVLIIVDMNEGFFPIPSEKDMFLNTSLRRRLGLPTYQEREGLYQYHFRCLRKGAKRIYLSYVDKPERGVRSRFIEELVFEELKKGRDLDKIEAEIKHYHPRENPPLQKDKKTLSLLEGFKFSPSALLIYQICPYQFYLKYILKIKPPLEIKETLTPQDIGQLLHDTLKEVYTKWQPWDMSERGLYQLLMKVLEKRLRHLPQFIYQPASHLGIEILKDRLKSFAKQEYVDFKSGWCPQPQWLEREIEVRLSQYGKDIVLKGIPDRIDKKRVKFRLLDYKTGAAPLPKQCIPGPWFRGIQLPFYLWLLNKCYGFNYKDCEVLGIYDLKSEFKIKEPYDCFIKFPLAYMNDFEAWLKQTLTDIFDSTKRWFRSPSPECNYCYYKDMCEENG
jgi:hypothetical protein